MLDLLRERRSIRKFKNMEVESEKINLLVKSVLLSPSSRNIRPWEFVFVTDRETIKKLAEAKEHGSAFLKEAPLSVVVFADTEKSDVWIEDASIASIVLQLEAESLGLGSCWVQIRGRKCVSGKASDDYIKELLGIPGNYSVESVIGIGYPDTKRPPYSDSDLFYDKVHADRYGNSMQKCPI